jgi:TonB-linked SusC/RagA family outer membrane protein
MKSKGNLPDIFRLPATLKVLRIMRCAVVLLLAVCLQVSAKGFSQDRVSLNLNDVEIRKILSAIEKKTNFRFLYNQQLVAELPKTAIVANDESVTDILDRVFENTDVSYQLLANKLIVLKEKNEVVTIAPIKGRVLSASGEPITGVSVTVKGSNSGTSTDVNGEFTIEAPDNAVLVISSVGFVGQEVTLKGGQPLRIVLQPSDKTMDEVVVIGYGTASKRDLTGSIVKIEGKDVANKPNTNPLSSLQGKVAGVSVVNNGVPGQQPDVRIRGTISINSVHPLYVVDGIFQDNIDYINPNDIESMEILKDPSSLAIFGVKGAAGVIAITTKKAKAGQVLVNFNTTAGVKQIADKIALASGDQFRQILAAEGANQNAEDAGDVSIKNFVANDIGKWTGNTDWVDALTRKAVFNTNNLSLTASSDKNKFYMGLGYTYDEGVVKHVNYKRINLSFGDEFKVSKALKLGFTFNGSREDLPYDGNGQLNAARQIFPIVESGTKNFKVRNPYGTPLDSIQSDLYSTLPVIQNSLANPALELENKWNSQNNIQYRALGSIFAEIAFLKNFTFRTTLYGDLANQNKTVYTPLYYAYDPGAQDQTYPVFLSSTQTKVVLDLYDRKRFQGDYILNYKKNFGDHSVTATAGWTHFFYGQYNTHAEVKQKSGDDPIPDNERFWYISSNFGDPTSRIATSAQSEEATLSALARVLYNYKGKYFLNGSFRRDGSSGINVGNKKYDEFWAVGAAWELTKENFMLDQKIFNFLKLKGSTGVLGNANLGGRPYAYYPTVSNTSSAVFGTNIVSAFTANFEPDPNLRWEKVHSQEVGVEFAALDNRLNGEIDYYNKTTKDLLVLFTPSGFLPTLRNSGSINNKGIEVSLGWSQKLGNDIGLNISANLTTYKNKVLSIGYPLPADPQYANQTSVGYPIGFFYGYKVQGIYQTQEEVDKGPVNQVGAPHPGDLRYEDIDGNDTLNDDDRTFIGNPTPDFTYGISAILTVKGFDIGLDISGSQGNEIYRYWGTSEQKNSVYNYPAYYANAWSGEGTSNSIPVVNAKHLINRVPSTYGIEDGSFVRIRNLSIGYNFRTAVLNRAKIKGLRIFVNVQNLKTWKHNIGYSPEYGGSLADQAIKDDEKGKAPSATSFGIDAGDSQGLLPRVWTGGINVTF